MFRKIFDKNGYVFRCVIKRFSYLFDYTLGLTTKDV